MSNSLIRIPNAININSLTEFTFELIIENLLPSTVNFIYKFDVNTAIGLLVYLNDKKGIAIWAGNGWYYSGSVYPFRYLALTYNSDENLFLYTDGFFQPLFDENGSSITYPATININNTEDLILGHSDNSIILRSFSIYNIALTPQNILKHYINYIGLNTYQDLVLSETSLISYWPLNDNSRFYKSFALSGKNSFNTGSNSYLCQLNYNYNSDTIFCGQNFIDNKQVEILYESGPILSITECTIEFWSFWDGTPIINKIFFTNISINDGIVVELDNLRFNFYTGVNWVTSDYIYLANKIQHFVGTVDSSGNIKIYVNGQLKNSFNSTINIINLFTSAFTLTENSQIKMWGLSLYNSVLSPTVINDHYSIGSYFDSNDQYIQSIIPVSGLSPYALAIIEETSVISYWIMNEISGSIIEDFIDSNTGNYLFNVNFVGNQLGNGNLGPSIKIGVFNQDGNIIPSTLYFIINDASNLHLTKLSLESWFQTSSLNRQTIFSKFNNAPPFFGFSIILNQGFIGIYVGVDSNGTSDIYQNAYNDAINSGKTIIQAKNLAQTAAYNNFSSNYTKYLNLAYNDNNWHYLVVTINDDGIIKLYVDSVLVFTFTLSPSLLNVAPLFIGADSLNGNAVFDGNLMDCAIYNDILDLTQIINHYTLGVGVISPILPKITPDYDRLILNEPSLISYWKLDEISGTVTYDIQDSNNGFYTGTYGLNQPGYQTLPICADFNNGYVDVPDAINLHNFIELTIECWINFAFPVANKHVFFNKSTTNGFSLFINNHTLQFFSGLTILDCHKIIDDGFWHYITATIDSTSLISLYIDGQKVGFIQTGIAINTTIDLTLASGLGGINYSVCSMMHCAIYNKALTPHNISLHYNTGIDNLGQIFDEEYRFTEQSGEIN